jgi:hypothetical protein
MIEFELIANQKLSIVIGNLSDTIVRPIRVKPGGFSDILDCVISLFKLSIGFLLLIVEQIGHMKIKCCSVRWFVSGLNFEIYYF